MRFPPHTSFFSPILKHQSNQFPWKDIWLIGELLLPPLSQLTSSLKVWVWDGQWGGAIWQLSVGSASLYTVSISPAPWTWRGDGWNDPYLGKIFIDERVKSFEGPNYLVTILHIQQIPVKLLHQQCACTVASNYNVNRSTYKPCLL